MNACNGCGACCEVLPVHELGLTGYTHCPHLSGVFDLKGIGCGVYADRPHSCRSWRCEWLKEDWPAEFRPDRIGLIVDENRDLISVDGVEVPAVQIWVMPGHEDDWQTSDVATSLIMTSIDEGLAVLWRMKGRMSMGFFRDPKTGALARSDPQMPTPDGAHSLGSVGERFWKADRLIKQQRR